MSLQQGVTPVADWYPDPRHRHEMRYWDGNSWTEHVADGGQASVDSALAGDSGAFVEDRVKTAHIDRPLPGSPQNVRAGTEIKKGSDVAMTGVAELITKDELTNSAVMEVLHRAYIGTDSSVLPTGGSQFDLDGIKMMVAVDPAKSVLAVAASFGLKPSANRMQAFELCNRINDGLVMIRACIPAVRAPAGGVWLDHYLVTTAGLTGEEIVDEVRRFRACIASAIVMDTDDIIA